MELTDSQLDQVTGGFGFVGPIDGFLPIFGSRGAFVERTTITPSGRVNHHSHGSFFTNYLTDGFGRFTARSS